MKRTRLEESTCPVARSLDIIGDWWSLLIVRDALRGVKRFGEFQKSLGIAKNMLTARLKLLVEEGILTLQPASDGSAWQEYVLTDKGRALQTVLVALSQWGNEFLFSQNQPGSVLVDVKNQQPLRKLALVANDGRELAPEDIALKLP
ncbi:MULTISPECIES: helix-turn-helix domain-containing protein [Enterobacter]|uniref:winged helix-turn-helix transcriptional regulator n=1 Tax=Enterobacter TaxID=547 RepID=UPI0028EB0FA5|nr:helix-turn-helix domain-containing protein [Enterobacter cloacae]HDR2752017.1 helix-turn-helix transcriptional regulator [Enterobacter asburiae]WNT38038.1 helix-turn-helix domain-containing protein [Enterobacter cloacae]HDR2789192.1 helix-turn-helix transcriptional regulator [Enterobacter asburiae]HDR2794156.1 helix-turn-helix transcriptional regulator [Enterobacter asburiae]HDR2799398.1 helix-turn-helix transcriptional regulator [Enterobacter asburiae]